MKGEIQGYRRHWLHFCPYGLCHIETLAVIKAECCGVVVRGHLGYYLVSLVSLYLLRVLYPFISCFHHSWLLLSVSCSTMPSILFKDYYDYGSMYM